MKATKNIPLSVIKDAVSVAGGLYRMNATSAWGYGFNVAANRKEVGCGAFLFGGDSQFDWEGFVCFRTKTFRDMVSGEEQVLS